jgi:FdhD protein
MGRVTTRRRVETIDADRRADRLDTLAVEEPLEIRVDGSALAVTMRTPGSDFELAQGFLLTEGIVRSREQIAGIRYCAGSGANEGETENTYNVLDVAVRDPAVAALDAARRNQYTTSSCGVCGKASLDAVVTTTSHDPSDDTITFTSGLIASLPDRLRTAQKVFDSTGGLHAAGLFDNSGRALVVREDVGRHNAVDKVIGWALEQELVPLRGIALCVSGRVSFELAQKATMAGIPVMVAVSAPSSLAVDLAERSGVTIAGFVRGDTMNVYTHPRRIVD